MKSTSRMMEIVHVHPDSESMPRMPRKEWAMLRMNDTAQLKGHISVSRKAI